MKTCFLVEFVRYTESELELKLELEFYEIKLEGINSILNHLFGKK